MTDLEVSAPLRQHGVVSLSNLLQPDHMALLSAPTDLRPTGYTLVDSILSGGLAPEELIVIGGRPGIGKSVTAVQWARNLASAGRTVVLACYEHSELIVMAQLLLIELGELVATPIESASSRGMIDRLISGQASWEETVKSDTLLQTAADRLVRMSDRIVVLDTRGRRGGFAFLRTAVESIGADVLVVDHLGKVDGLPGDAAIACKELAVETGATVIATAMTSDSGIASKRLRGAGLADAARIAHESDIELLLNDKLSIVSRNHSAFDSVRAESFHSKVIFSIEKNRRGVAGLDFEFTRDFAHRRFDVDGGYVPERLIDDVLVRE